MIWVEISSIPNICWYVRKQRVSPNPSGRHWLTSWTAESTMFRLGNLRVNRAVDRKRSQAAGPCDGWEVSEGNSQGCRPGVMNAYSRYAAMVI